MNSQVLRVRIRTEDKGDVEWSAKPDDLTFGNALFAISQVLPNVSVTAFEYEDEDGDRITVRTDEELQTMLKNFMYNLDGLPELPPLVIFPRVGKTPQDRNIHGLKIQTRRGNPRPSPVPQPAPQPAQPKPVPVQSNPAPADGSRRASGNIEEILRYGNIKDGDLHYQQVLGNGNGGSVFRSIHVPSNKTMAVKVIELDITKDVQKQIISELQVLDQCQSDNIITFYGAFFEENRISICMEFMDGGSLDRLGVIPEPVLGQMTVSILRGLLYLWSKKIMHRDVKPSNILVNTMGQVKLCDFGVSKELVNSITKTYVGTNAYMAPERIEGKEYSLQSDVWSLGVTLFQLATGKYPYNKALLNQESPPQACMAFLNSIVNENPPTLPAEFFPLDLISFVAGCMRQAPKDRLRPVDMENHGFILRHMDNKMVDVAGWVRQRLMEVHQASQTL